MGYRINRLTRSLERRKGANRRFYMEAAAKPKKRSSTTDEHRWTRICSVLPKRADYGEEILHTLSAKLVSEFGRGFSERNLANMVRCAEAFPDPKILHALSAKLSWSHLREIIYLGDPLKRDFYAEMCRIEQWNTRRLRPRTQAQSQFDILRPAPALAAAYRP